VSAVVLVVWEKGGEGRYAGFAGAAVTDADEFGDVVPWLGHGLKAEEIDLGDGSQWCS